MSVTSAAATPRVTLRTPGAAACGIQGEKMSAQAYTEQLIPA